MDGKMIQVFLLVLLVKFPTQSIAQILDYKAWLGEEPLTTIKILDDVVEYFSVRDPHGIPVMKVPELIHIPGTLAVSGIEFYDPNFSGHSELRLQYVNINLTSLSAKAKVRSPKLNFNGEYTWPMINLGFYSQASEGFANLTMLGLEATMDLFVTINDDGLLTLKPQLDMMFEEKILNFTGLLTAHRVAVSGADYIFSSIIQPFIFSQIQPLLQSSLNGFLGKAIQNISFPDSISPVDFAIVEARIGLRKNGKDPLKLRDMEFPLTWGVTAQLQNIILIGLTTLHRTHEISAQFIDNVVYATVQLGTQKLEAHVDWSLSASILPAVGGHMSVEIDSVSVNVELQQPANIRSPPTLRRIDVALGNFAVRSHGDSTFDYLVEMLVNILPNCFRDQIMDAVEPILHEMIQQKFNKLDLYRFLIDKLNKDKQD